jgi:hypothetical protein
MIKSRTFWIVSEKDGTYIHEWEGAFRTDDSLEVGDTEALWTVVLALSVFHTLQHPSADHDLRK